MPEPDTAPVCIAEVTDTMLSVETVLPVSPCVAEVVGVLFELDAGISSELWVVEGGGSSSVVTMHILRFYTLKEGEIHRTS